MLCSILPHLILTLPSPWHGPHTDLCLVSFHCPPFNQLSLLPRTCSPALPALRVKLHPIPVQFTWTFSLWRGSHSPTPGLFIPSSVPYMSTGLASVTQKRCALTYRWTWLAFPGDHEHHRAIHHSSRVWPGTCALTKSIKVVTLKQAPGASQPQHFWPSAPSSCPWSLCSSVGTADLQCVAKALVLMSPFWYIYSLHCPGAGCLKDWVTRCSAPHTREQIWDP